MPDTSPLGDPENTSRRAQVVRLFDLSPRPRRRWISELSSLPGPLVVLGRRQFDNLVSEARHLMALGVPRREAFRTVRNCMAATQRGLLIADAYGVAA